MNDFLYLIRVVVVNFSVKTHEMNEAYIQAPPTIKIKQSDKENTEDTLFLYGCFWSEVINLLFFPFGSGLTM